MLTNALCTGKENLPKFSLADTTHHEHQSSSRMAKVKGQGADSDILYQWRLKRKLETARTAAKAVSTDPSSYLQSRTPVEDASSNVGLFFEQCNSVLFSLICK